MSSHTKAYLTLNSFEAGGDGGVPSDRDKCSPPVVDECDSTTGCDKDHSYQPPCANSVGASKVERKALGIPLSQWVALILHGLLLSLYIVYFTFSFIL